MNEQLGKLETLLAAAPVVSGTDHANSTGG